MIWRVEEWLSSGAGSDFFRIRLKITASSKTLDLSGRVNKASVLTS